MLAKLWLGTGSFVSVMMAALVSFVAGVLAGYPAKRLRGLYLALITLILAVSVVPLIKQFKAYTGGAAGLLVDKPMPPTWFTLGQDAWIYYIVLAFTVVAFWLIRNFVGGSVGRALAGVREGDLAASSMGIDVNMLKVVVFGVGAMLAGVGGALATFTIGFIGPDSFTMMLSIGFLAAIVAASNAGGAGSVVGDTTTTMMWIAGVPPQQVLDAYVAAVLPSSSHGGTPAMRRTMRRPGTARWTARSPRSTPRRRALRPPRQTGGTTSTAHAA